MLFVGLAIIWVIASLFIAFASGYAANYTMEMHSKEITACGMDKSHVECIIVEGTARDLRNLEYNWTDIIRHKK